MAPLNDLSEILYLLIYHRGFRTKFLAGKYEELSIDPLILEEIRDLDAVNLEKTAELVVRQFLGADDSMGFQKKFKKTLQLWRELFPADNEALELVFLFLESEDFKLVENVPTTKHTRHLFEVFRQFLLKKLPDVPKFQELRASLNS